MAKRNVTVSAMATELSDLLASNPPTKTASVAPIKTAPVAAPQQDLNAAIAALQAQLASLVALAAKQSAVPVKTPAAPTALPVAKVVPVAAVPAFAQPELSTHHDVAAPLRAVRETAHF